MKFDFTEEEVQLNKNGILSPRQKAVCKATADGMRSSARGGIWLVLGFSALGLCIILGLQAQTLNERNFQTLGPQMLFIFCLSVGIAFGVIALMLFTSHRQAARIESAPLLSAEGIISHDSDYSSNAGFRSYYVYFGKKRFSFLNDMSRDFPNGSRYRIYYCKAGQIELIMSFERLE